MARKKSKSIGKSIQSVSPVSAGRGLLPADVMLLAPATIAHMPQPFSTDMIRKQMKLSRKVKPVS